MVASRPELAPPARRPRRPALWIAALAGLAAGQMPELAASPGSPASVGAPAPVVQRKQARSKVKKEVPRFHPFEGTLEESKKLAFDRNVPLVLIAILETDPWNEKEHEDIETYRRRLLEDSDFEKAAEYAVVMMANNRVHPIVEVEIEVAGEKVVRSECSRYRTTNCAAHQKPFDEIYNAYNKDGELLSPATFVLTPDREMHTEFHDSHAPELGHLVDTIEEAAKKAGEGLTNDELVSVRGLLARGRTLMNAGTWGESYRTWDAVLEITEKTRYAVEAREQQAMALTGLEEARDAALALLALEDPTQIVEGYKQLLALVDDSVGSPLEKELPKLVKGAERDKRIKDVIAAYQREREAEQMWNDILDLLREDEERKAMGKAKLLLRKYPDTAAGKRAAQRWPELAGDGG